MTKALAVPHRLLSLVLLLAGIAALGGGCIVVPVGGYGYRAPRPVVVAPAPIVVVPARRWYW
jgi:hypothetical protein